MVISSVTEGDSLSKRPLELDSAGGSNVGAAAPSQGSKTGGSKVDPELLVYLYLVEAAMTCADSAMVKSKQLNANAVAQQKINREASAMKWVSVPNEQVKTNHHTMYEGHKWTKGSWWDCWIPIPHDIKKTLVTHEILNEASIQAANSQNQVMFATRTLLEDKVTVLQQTASVGETSVSTQAQESMQAMQEGSNLLQIAQSLTFKAMLTQPPQGS